MQHKPLEYLFFRSCGLFFFSCVLKYSKQYFILQDHHVFLLSPPSQLLSLEDDRGPTIRIIIVVWQITNLIQAGDTRTIYGPVYMIAQISFQFMTHKNMNGMDGRKTNGLVRINMVFLQVLSSVCKLSSPALVFLSPKAQ